MATKTAPKKRAPRKAAPRKDKDSVVVDGIRISRGATTLRADDGQFYGSLACGEHNKLEIVSLQDEVVHKVGGRPHVKNQEPAGFQPDCADCLAEAASTIDHARRHAGP